jgi:hypothetical protein
MHPENDNDREEAYIVTPGYDSEDDEVQVASSPFYTGNQADGYVQLESNDDIEAAVDEYGSYSEVDTDEQGGFTLMVASGQSTAGAAITGADGELSAEGGGTVDQDVFTPTYEMADGVFDTASNIGDVKDNENVVLVGGPNANALTQELVDDNQTMPASDYTEGQGMIQMVDGFSEGNSALVVAGQSGADPTAAAEFLANYRDNQDALEGQSEVTINTETNSVVN